MNRSWYTEQDKALIFKGFQGNIASSQLYLRKLLSKKKYCLMKCEVDEIIEKYVLKMDKVSREHPDFIDAHCKEFGCCHHKRGKRC